MKVTFIGAGNVATHLATTMLEKGYEIAQIYSYSEESAKSLADKLNKPDIYTNRISDIYPDSDLYIFALKDSVLQEVASQLSSNNGIWIHTAGSMPLDIFKGLNKHYGVIYPLQTFSKNKPLNWDNIPLFLEASDTDTLSKLQQVAQSISSNVYELNSDKRKYVHLTGVFACNFTNYMYSVSADILKDAGLPFEVALPLIEETCAKVHTLSPIEAQTGPAVRYDENVMQKHLSLIDDEQLKELYHLISKKIYENHKNINKQ